MSDIYEDAIINVIENGIKKGIRIALDNECLRAAVILIYSGIDTFAFLGMPENREKVTKRDFITWADRFIEISRPKVVNGDDLYGARCAMLHSYGIESGISRQGKCKCIAYMDADGPIVYNPNVDRNIVAVSVHHLARAFFKGVDDFLVYTFANTKSAEMAERRLKEMVHEFDYNEEFGKCGQ